MTVLGNILRFCGLKIFIHEYFTFCYDNYIFILEVTIIKDYHKILEIKVKFNYELKVESSILKCRQALR